MLTLEEKRLLEQRIYDFLNESVFEVSSDNNSDKKINKRQSVMKWLNSAQQIHSTLAYELWGKSHASEDDKASARSLFSKKYRGEDADGKHYEFNDDEINSLYNMKDRFIKNIK